MRAALAVLLLTLAACARPDATAANATTAALPAAHASAPAGRSGATVPAAPRCGPPGSRIPPPGPAVFHTVVEAWDAWARADIHSYRLRFERMGESPPGGLVTVRADTVAAFDGYSGAAPTTVAELLDMFAGDGSASGTYAYTAQGVPVTLDPPSGAGCADCTVVHHVTGFCEG